MAEAEASGKKKIRVPRKFLIATAGILMLLGGSGAAALYVGKDQILGPSKESINGLDCTDIARVAIKRDDGQIWLHKYIMVEPSDGPTRMKTAIRVVATMAETLRAELIHVVLLDKNGPKKRSEMNGRSVGAEVFFVRNPGTIRGFDAPYSGYYFTGMPTAEGRFYGEERVLTAEQIKAVAAAMKDKADCARGDADTADAGGHKAAEPAKPKEGEATPASAHGEAAPVEEVKAVDPAEAEFDQVLGIQPPEEPKPVEDVAVEPDAGSDKSFLDTMMGMVGLGGDEPAAENAAAGDHAAPPAHGEAPADAGHAAAPEGEHGAAPAADGEHGAASEDSGAHDAHALPPNAIDLRIPKAPEPESSFFSSVLGAVGLDGDKDVPAADGHGAAEGHEAPAADGHSDGHEAAPANDHGAAETGHDASESGHAAPVASTHSDATGAAASGHGTPETEGQSAGHAAAPVVPPVAESVDLIDHAKASLQHTGPVTPAEDIPSDEPTDAELEMMKAKSTKHDGTGAHKKAGADHAAPAH